MHYHVTVITLITPSYTETADSGILIGTVSRCCVHGLFLSYSTLVSLILLPRVRACTARGKVIGLSVVCRLWTQKSPYLEI
jgi:hypothetical protein